MLLVAVVSMSPMFLYASGATLVGAAGIGYALYKLDTRVEGRRKHAIEISNQAAQFGFDHTAQILACYAVGDYDGIYDKAREIYSIFKDDDLRVAYVRKLFFGLLERYLKDPARASEILKAVDDHRASEKAKLDKALADARIQEAGVAALSQQPTAPASQPVA